MSTETLTFLFTDIEGSTALLGRLGEGTYAEVLAEHHRVIRAGLATLDGKEIGTQGDGFFAVFSSPRACAAAVVEMQRALETHQWSATAASSFFPKRSPLSRDRLPAGVYLRDLGLHRLKDLGHPQHIFQVQAEGLTPDSPPLRSLDNPALANNLPVQWVVELAPVSNEDAVPETIAHALGITNQSARPALETLVDALLPQRPLIILDNCEHLIGSCAKVADTILRRCPGVHLIATSREPLGIGGETIYRVPSMSLPTSGEDRAPGLDGSDAAALFVERARTQGTARSTPTGPAPIIDGLAQSVENRPVPMSVGRQAGRAVTRT